MTEPNADDLRRLIDELRENQQRLIEIQEATPDLIAAVIAAVTKPGFGLGER